MKVRIGTRGSDLALWQARHVAGRLQADGHEVETCVMKTRGDRIVDVPLTTIEGKAFFTAELEEALLDGRVDLAVHSHKDLPVDGRAGLAIVAVPRRGPAGERLLVARHAHDPEEAFLPLARGACLGTSSPRRAEQVLVLRPDLRVLPLRGNVPTRVQRLREGRFDAIVLAAAGLDRLGLDTTALVDVALPIDLLVPAPAQGALAVQTRADDRELAAICGRILHDSETARIVAAERSVLAAAGGGCNLPLGCTIEPEGSGFRARVFLGADHPAPGCRARWAEAFAQDLDAVVGAAFHGLVAERPTRCGPLRGLRVALTGSAAGGTLLGERLSSLGAETVHERVIAFEDLESCDLARRLAALAPGDGLALTSREAARRLAGLSVPPGVVVGAVGSATGRGPRSTGRRRQ